QDDEGGVPQLGPIGPGDLLELVNDLFAEFACPGERTHIIAPHQRERGGAAADHVPPATGSLRFLVLRMRIAPRAVLPPLRPLGVRALVLRRVIVPLLALRAGEDDLVARHAPGLLIVRAAAGTPT